MSKFSDKFLNLLKLNDDEVAVGNKEYMKTLKIKVPKFKSTGLIVYVAINNQYEGYIIWGLTARIMRSAAQLMNKAGGI